MWCIDASWSKYGGKRKSQKACTNTEILRNQGEIWQSRVERKIFRNRGKYENRGGNFKFVGDGHQKFWQMKIEIKGEIGKILDGVRETFLKQGKKSEKGDNASLPQEGWTPLIMMIIFLYWLFKLTRTQYDYKWCELSRPITSYYRTDIELFRQLYAMRLSHSTFNLSNAAV